MGVSCRSRYFKGRKGTVGRKLVEFGGVLSDIEGRHYGSFWTLIGQEKLSREVMICDSMALLCDGGKG